MAVPTQEEANFERFATSNDAMLGLIGPPPGLEKPNVFDFAPPLGPPPGLEKANVFDFGPPPGLASHCPLPSSGHHPVCAPVAVPSALLLLQLLEQDSQRRIYQQHLHQQNEHLLREQSILAKDNACLKTKLATRDALDVTSSVPPKPPGIFEEVGSNISSKSTVPLKPLGGLDRSSSNHSLVSTAATVTGDTQDDKLEEVSAILPPSFMQPGVAAVPKAAVKEVARELHTEDLGNGRVKVHWPVDAKKLRGKDMQIVSSRFEIFAGCALKLMLKPTSKGDKRCQKSFSKAGGWGSVELKLVESGASAPTLRFRISVGGNTPRGPIEHDFSYGAVYGSSKEGNLFDFMSAVDPNSSTFLVSLEVLPSGA